MGWRLKWHSVKKGLVHDNIRRIKLKLSYKKVKADKEMMKAAMLKLQEKPKNTPSNLMYKKYAVAERDFGGCRCYFICPKTKFSGKYIFYLYGGAVSFDISKPHWDFISELCDRTNYGIFVPMYPLAPKHSCREVFDALGEVYDKFSKRKDVEEIHMMGDSFGAGLALSLSLMAWRDGKRRPDKVTLLSPVIDTEFFDKSLEKQVIETNANTSRYFYSEGLKDYINTYWVRDYAAKTEYTSPFYEDFTDVCNEMTIFSGIGDLFNCYAREFYKKVKRQGIKVSLYEFENEEHNFLLHSKTGERRRAMGYLCDTILGKRDACLKDIYPIKLMADWSKKIPDVVKDDWAVKFIYEEKIDFSSLKTNISEYDFLRLAVTNKMIDDLVKDFLVRYPWGTVVYVGCELDNLFGRTDNGKVRWYSIDTHSVMTVRRNIYGDRAREKTIGRAIMDFSWIEEIKCQRKHGVLFVTGEVINHCSINQVKLLFEKIHETFPGCELLLNTCSAGVTFLNNHRNKHSAIKRFRRRFFVNDTQKLLDDWSADYKLISELPVFTDLAIGKKRKFRTKFKILYTKISHNYKISRIRMGSEAYDINV